MAINIIREFTPEDEARVEAAALRFAYRHDLGIYDDEGTAEEQVLHYCDDAMDGGRLAGLWQAAFCRALRLRPAADVTVEHGYVGTRA